VTACTCTIASTANAALHVPDALPFVMTQSMPAGELLTRPEPVPTPPPMMVKTLIAGPEYVTVTDVS
jgi:hypothetical protein